MYLYFGYHKRVDTASDIGLDASSVGQKATHLHSYQHDIVKIASRCVAILDIIRGGIRILC